MEFRPPGVPPADLVDLYRKHALSEREYQMAIEWATKPPARERWAGYLRDWFLIFGVLMLVAGVIVFGAYNWQTLHRYAKLGILEMLILGSWLGSRLRDRDSIESTMLLWASCLLVGALLAVFGQIYQTGADAYALFVSWAALILPWCLAGRSNLIWMTQMILLDLSFSLYWFQVVSDDFGLFSVCFAGFNAVLVLLWERARARAGWPAPAMTDGLLAIGLTPLTGAGGAAFWEGEFYGAALVAAMLSWPILYRLYGDRVRTMSLVACSAVTLGCAVMVWVFLDQMDGGALGFLMVAGGLVVEITLAGRWLKHIHARAHVAQTEMIEADRPCETMPTVIEVLAQNGLLDETPGPQERQVEPETPRYVSLLTAMGAWISSWFFLGFVVLGVSDSESGMLTLGLLLFAGSILARRTEMAKVDFFAQTCLAVNMAGQLLTLIGTAGSYAGDFHTVAAVALTLQLSALFTYKDALGRCLFAFASVLSGGALFWDTAGGQGWNIWLLLVAFMISRLLIGQRGWLLSRWRNWYGAVAFGSCCGLLTTVGVWGLNWPEFGVPQPAVLTGGLTLLAAACAVRLQAPLTAVVALLVLGALTFTMPGVMAALLVFILAFHTRSLGAWWLSVLALLVFGILYYYNLDLTFLAKSATLVASGVVLLMARATLKRQAPRHAF